MKHLTMTIKRELHRLSSRTVYLFAMIVVPIFCCWFFISLMSQGLPLKVPVAIVDLDHSELSRQVTRSLGSEELIDVARSYEAYNDALAAVRRGEVFGFFVIPQNFETNAIGGRKPALDFYTNMTYFVPGTLSYKGFKTMAVTTTAGMVKTQLVDIGATDRMTTALIQPVNFITEAPGNPWTNYAYYLTPSFFYGVLALMIALITVFSITTEIKDGTSLNWLRTAGGSVIIAVSGKLLPQTVILTLVGWLCQAIMLGFNHFPVAGNPWVMIATMPLFVIANQALGLFISSLLPNPRLAFSITALTCILTFSFAGFSFPVENMYGWIGVFSYIVPVRYYFLLHTNEALFAAPLYYSRFLIMALIAFPIVAMLPLGNLKRWMKKPVYLP